MTRKTRIVTITDPIGQVVAKGNVSEDTINAATKGDKILIRCDDPWDRAYFLLVTIDFPESGESEAMTALVRACPACGLEIEKTCEHEGVDCQAQEMSADNARELRSEYAADLRALLAQYENE